MILRARSLAILLMLSAICFASGVVVQRIGLFGKLLDLIALDHPSKDRIQAAPAWRDPFVLLVVGQSNAANHGSQPGRSGPDAYALAVDGLYPLEDPLPGASGTGGSPWPYWASLRRSSGSGSQVVVASIAQGSSSVRDWIDSGVHAKRLRQIVVALNQWGLQIDAVVWHQGETESWSFADPDIYATSLNRWIARLRALGVQAPVFVCLTTRDGSGVINPSIRSAQASVWNVSKNVFAGPDTDSLGADYRSDGVHFNQMGLEAFATLVQQAIDYPSAKSAPRLLIPTLNPAQNQ